MSRSLRRLPDAELEVMNALWACAYPASRADIEAHLHAEHSLAATTVLTLLQRLSDKGFLRMDKQGRANGYTPLVEKQEYLAAQSRRFVDKLCGGSISAFAAALCGSGLTREELDELRALLEKGEL